MNIAIEESRGATPVVGIILIVAITLVIAVTLSATVLDVSERLNGWDEQRVFQDATVELGTEYRSWGGGGGEDNPDIDTINLAYQHGPIFESDEIGSILIKWEGNDGQRGQLRFVNPNRFTDDTDQQYHDGDVGKVCTGDIRAGGKLTIRMVHNRNQSGGETDPDKINPKTGETFGERYVESNDNSIVVNNDPFFTTEGRYPVEFSGDRPMKSGDSVEILFLSTDDKLILAKSSGVARKNSGEPIRRDDPVTDC